MFFSIHTDRDVKESESLSGYTYGYRKIIEHFSQYEVSGEKLSVLENSPVSKVQMFYMEPNRLHIPSMRNTRDPNFLKFHKHQYKIYGTHLEATRVWSHWMDEIKKADEIWVGNYFARDAVINSGIEIPTYVFEHGIDSMWKPKRRGRKSKIKFLHVDSGSPRKRADLVEQAFRNVFDGYEDVELTLKYRPGEDVNGFSVMSIFGNQNVNKIFKNYTQEEMLQLYYDHDVLVYPSEGEGFGFIPLQALATGMPVISTGAWCSYERFLGSNIIDSTIGPTKHTGYFEGEVVLPDYDSLAYLLKKVYENIDDECNFYYKQAPQIHEEYNWQRKCNEMLDSFVSRKGLDILDIHPDYEKQLPVEIFYTGNGRYSTPSGVLFSTDCRSGTVPKSEYESLMLSGNFKEVL